MRARTEGAGQTAKSRQEALRDAGLVRQFNAGDETAFAEIIRCHRGKIFSLALGYLRNHADAEEITQDTFIRAHRGLGRFRGDSSLATWLRHIARNLAHNRYWYFFRRGRQTTYSLDFVFRDDDQATFAGLVATETGDPARDAVASEFAELVAVCMERLGASAREILSLRNSSDHSYDEIARELGINIGTVKSRIARARESLRLLLAETCPEFGPDARPAAWFEPVRAQSGVETSGN